MKSALHKFPTPAVLLVLSCLPIYTNALAIEDKNPATVSVAPDDNSVQMHKLKALAAKDQQLINEAKESVLATEQALLNIEKKDNPAALTALQVAAKKLAQILNQSPALLYVAADVEVDVMDFKGDDRVVAAKVKQAAELLSRGKLQAGRMVADELASEMDITTINIPLSTFPLAIKNAIAALNAGKVSEATQIVETALDSLVENVEIIPLPLVRAESLLLKAFELEQQSALAKDKARDAAFKLVDKAKEQLKIAQLLGYGDKQDYEPFYKVISEIKSTLYTEKSTATWEKIKLALIELKNKVTPAKK
jgi:hypothetical protein